MSSEDREEEAMFNLNFRTRYFFGKVTSQVEFSYTTKGA